MKVIPCYAKNYPWLAHHVCCLFLPDHGPTRTSSTYHKQQLSQLNQPTEIYHEILNPTNAVCILLTATLWLFYIAMGSQHFLLNIVNSSSNGSLIIMLVSWRAHHFFWMMIIYHFASCFYSLYSAKFLQINPIQFQDQLQQELLYYNLAIDTIVLQIIPTI